VSTARARAAAADAFGVLADLVAAGAEASGAFAEAELLRAIHACRSEGLHRLAAAQTRALRSLRELRADRPEFALAALTADMRDALAVAHALAAGAAELALLGTARRGYQPIGPLRLFGICTEAIVARSGFGGAVTYLADERGALYTRADVGPGEAGRAAGTYAAATWFGELELPHRELCRRELFAEAATASADGRLGAGRRVRGVRVRAASRWDADPIDARFRVPLAEQLAAIAARDADPAEARPAGAGLVFVEGTLAPGPTGVAIRAPRGPGGHDVLLRVQAAPHRALPGRDNLVVLSRAAGLRVRAIGHVRIGAPRDLDLLAIGPAPAERRFAMPDAWQGRANVHFDRIPALAIPDRDAPTSPAPPPPTEDLLAPLRRRIERVVLGGAGTLSVHARPQLEREAAALAERALGGGAEALLDLSALAARATPAHAGAGAASPEAAARRGEARAAFASAWLRATLYEDAARRRLSVASW
jgi:hypothetical protein